MHHAEGRVAGAKVVDAQLNAPFPQGCENGLGGFSVIDQGTFGNFQAQMVIAELVLSQHSVDVLSRALLANCLADRLTLILNAVAWG
jgi:hypothetical protein